MCLFCLTAVYLLLEKKRVTLIIISQSHRLKKKLLSRSQLQTFFFFKVDISFYPSESLHFHFVIIIMITMSNLL